ncbi:MAG: hypothetical protein R3A48_16070 [Polyangiales bacterium]
MNRRTASLLALVAVGCAARSAPRGPRYCVEPRRAAPGGEVTAAVERDEPQRVTVTSESRTLQSIDRSEEDEPPCVSPSGRIAALEGEVAQGMAAFAAESADCRSACRAATGVCAASAEICRLTGDHEAVTPLDPRCARARAACEDASRQRTERCPVCPVE